MTESPRGTVPSFDETKLSSVQRILYPVGTRVLNTFETIFIRTGTEGTVTRAGRHMNRVLWDSTVNSPDAPEELDAATNYLRLA